MKYNGHKHNATQYSYIISKYSTKKGGHVDAINSKSDAPLAEWSAKFLQTYKSISFPHIEDI